MPKALKIFAVSLLAFAATSVAACNKKDSAPPVATPSFSANKDRVALGGPIEFTFQFDVVAPIKDNYRVLVHVVNPDGDTLWIDDHDPAVPTSQWKAGQKIQYTRQRFVPVVPFTGEATVRVGLYKGDERLPLQGADPDQRTYKVGTLQLLPQSENVFLIYKSGWHAPEFAPDNSDEWQWSQKSGVVNFKNPRKDVTLYLEMDARADLFPVPQQVTLVLAGKPIKTITMDSTTKKLLTIPVTAAELGGDDMVELRIDVDKTFVLAQLGKGSDSRELGVRVSHIFVEPK
jgi:hypothetical protein